MIDVGEKIRAWRTVKGLSQTALAERAGTAGNMIGVYERGKSSPTVHQLDRIAAAMRLTLTELLSGPSTEPAQVSEPTRPWGGAQPASDVCLIPYCEMWNGERLDAADLARWPVARTLVAHEECLVTRIHDDAMHPYLMRGDAVVVDPDANKPRSGSLVLLRSGDEVHVRRYLVLKRQRTFEAYNPLYPPIRATDEHHVIGRIIAMIERNLRGGIALQMGWADTEGTTL